MTEKMPRDVEHKQPIIPHRVFIIGASSILPNQCQEDEFVFTPEELAEVMYDPDGSLIGILPESRRDTTPYGEDGWTRENDGIILGDFFSTGDARQMQKLFTSMVPRDMIRNAKWKPKNLRSPEETLAVAISLRALEAAGITPDKFDDSIHPWQPKGEREVRPLRWAIGFTNSIGPMNNITNYIEEGAVGEIKGKRRRGLLNMAFGGFSANTNGAIREALLCQGPAIPNQAACATFGFNLDGAFKEMFLGQADLAIVGGFELFSNPKMTYFLADIGAQAPYEKFENDPTKACRPGDRGACGLVPLEGGIGTILATEEALERLHIPAEQVRAEVIGTATGQDWTRIGLPDPAVALARVQGAAIDFAGITPDMIRVYGPHSPGTKEGEGHEWPEARRQWGLPPREFNDPPDNQEYSDKPFIILGQTTHGHNLAGSQGLTLTHLCTIFERDGELPVTKNIGPDGPHGMAFNLNRRRGRKIDVEYSLATGIGVEASVASIVIRRPS